MKPNNDPPQSLLDKLRDGELLRRALEKAACRTILEHKREGLPLAMWRDGRVVWIPAEELEGAMTEKVVIEPRSSQRPSGHG